MKRHKDLFEEICSIENLVLADRNARKGKLAKKSVKEHLNEEHTNIIKLHFDLVSKRYTTSEYTTFKIFEGKERTISN
jgi:RNA-directed DNA polymerase